MVGLMQIMIYMLSVYLVYKGLEILQIAVMSARENRTPGILIGVTLTVLAVIVGLGFSIWADSVAQSIGDRMNNMPKFP